MSKTVLCKKKETLVVSHLENIEDDEYLQKLSKSILYDINWFCKGKYGILSVLVGHLGSTRMLLWHSGIARQVLQQLQEQTLACYVSNLLLLAVVTLNKC